MNKGDLGYVYAVVDQKDYNLTFAQQEFVKKNTDKFPLVELLQKTFKEPSLNERSVEYDELRKYIAKVKRDIRKIDFTEDQINFMESNSDSMRPFELAKTIFPDIVLQPLSAEVKLIAKYLKALGLSNGEDRDGEEYRPPKAAASLVRKINKADPVANFDANDLTPAQRKCIDSLRSYLQSIRFCSYMKILILPEMKEIFEEEFIKGTYDKSDLNSEELNMYINLCMEYVNLYQIQKRKISLETKINDSVSDNTDDGKKLYMTFVELLSGYDRELSASKKQTQELQVKLSNTRSARLKGMAEVNESLSRFVEEWKSEEGRKRALKIAEAQNKLVSAEIDRLENVEEYIANIRGVGRQEILRN